MMTVSLEPLLDNLKFERTIRRNNTNN